MKHFSLFTGSGIGDYAAEQCGFETVAQCENDPACLFCLSRMFPNAKRFSDIKSITDDDVRRLGRIDLISGGFPCQDISSEGKMAGLDGDRSSLWFEMLRIINAARPAWLLIENVPALRVRGADRVLAGLEESGYTCWAHVVGTNAFAGNIKRERVWIVAIASGLGLQAGNMQKSRMQELQDSRETVCQHAYGIRNNIRKTRSEAFSAFPRETDGLAGGLPTKVRNSLLRMVGNGWTYPVALMFFKWIAKQIQAEAIA